MRDRCSAYRLVGGKAHQVRRLLSRLARLASRSDGYALLGALVSLVVAGLTIAVVAMPATAPSASVLAPQQFDMVIVAGPFRFEATGALPAIYIEQLTLEVQPGRTYTLVLDNGGPDGANRVTSAT